MPIFLGNQTGSDVAAVWADEAPVAAPNKPVQANITADAATQAAFASFLRDYHHALQTNDARFLVDHTSLPLPLAEIEYDMEAKPSHRKVVSIAKLLRARKRLLWPVELVPKSPEQLGKLRRGTEKCDDPKSPDKPNFEQGEPAVTLHESSATLTYLAEPCAAETHHVTLVFAHVGTSWQLRERTVKQ